MFLRRYVWIYQYAHKYAHMYVIKCTLNFTDYTKYIKLKEFIFLLSPCQIMKEEFLYLYPQKTTKKQNKKR